MSKPAGTRVCMWRAGWARHVASVGPRHQRFGFEMLGNRASGYGWLAGGPSPPRVNLTGAGATNTAASSSHLRDTAVPLQCPFELVLGWKLPAR